MLNKNDFYKVKYIGESNPLMLLHDKVYVGRVLQKNWFGIVDETNEEYAYPPEAFEILEKVTLTPQEYEKHISSK